MERRFPLNRLLIIYSVLTITAVGLISSANAEEYWDSVKFPIPDNVDDMQKVCKIKSISSIGLHYGCDWMFLFGDAGIEWYDDLIEEQGLIHNATSTEKPEPVESNFTPIEKPDDLVTFEDKLKEYEETPPESYDDLEEMKKLQTLAECQQGLDNTRGIQNERTFWTSEYQESFATPHAGHYSQIDLAIQECIAQKDKLEPLLGRGAPTKEGEYLSAQDFFGSEQPYHSDKVSGLWDWIPTHATDSKVTDESHMKREAITAHDNMCESEFVTLAYKIQQDCKDIKIWHDGEFTIYGEETTEPNTAIANGSRWTTGLVGDGNFNGWDTPPRTAPSPDINKPTYEKSLYDIYGDAGQLAKNIEKSKAAEVQHQIAINKATLGIEPYLPEPHGLLPPEGWTMIPQDERTNEFYEARCDKVKRLPTDYEIAVCGK